MTGSAAHIRLLRLHSMLAALMLCFTAMPAYAQYHEFTPETPAVEVDMDALDAAGIPKTWKGGYKTEPTVESQPLPAAPSDAMLKQWREKRLLKPVFTPTAPATMADELPMKKPATTTGDAEGEKQMAAPLTPIDVTEQIHETAEITPQEQEEPVAAATDEAIPTPEEEHAARMLPPVDAPADIILVFSGAESQLDNALQSQITPVLDQMKTNPASRLQVRAYALGQDGSKASARRISLSRALAVRSYLMDMGIKPSRIDVRALGAATQDPPLDRVDLVIQ